jgi:hypothetical protein
MVFLNVFFFNILKLFFIVYIYIYIFFSISHQNTKNIIYKLIYLFHANLYAQKQTNAS